ncbi:MAG TPA: serine/threonine-protein kinase, partial [Gemmataceae bacterium]|nr:serine/threonine-protein kinase [Gemmataceae bacterium]
MERETLERLGDFRILREIGRGGMGVVYEAEQVSLGRHVALKVLPRQMLANARTRQRFEREARAAARLHHTNIVPVFGVGEHDGQPYYAMQFIDGAGLDVVIAELAGDRLGAATPSRSGVSAIARSLLTSDHPPAADADRTLDTAEPRPGPSPDGRPDPSHPPSTLNLPGQSAACSGGSSHRASYWHGVARVGLQVAEALEHAHRQGILHRDVKPSNLLLDQAGTVWVTDFGLAKAREEDGLTQTGDIVGTLRYMAPER